jgi:rsbT co-antagonist protein RsbR
MNNQDAARYAEATAKMISVRGEEPRARVLTMLRGLALTEGEATQVVEEGLRSGAFTEDPSAAVLRIPRREDDAALVEQKKDAARRVPAYQILEPILDNLPIIMWVAEPSGLFLRYEGRGVDRLGVEQGHLVGKNYFELFSEHKSAADVHAALAGQPSHSFTEYKGVPYENWCAPLFDAQGRVEFILFISLDITDAKRAEAALIEKQRHVIRELSTPIIQVWHRVLALPLLGVVDSGRAAEVMENLLMEVARTRARFAILDLTGVEAMDTATVSHIVKLIQALRLLGAEGIITGIGPNVARTMVGFGIDLDGIMTLANLQSGLQFCMKTL